MGLIRKEDLHESFWLEGISNPNLLINGDFQVWQRGTSFNLSKNDVKYTSDRWKVWCNNDTPIKISNENGLKFEGANSNLYYHFEDADFNKINNKVVTMSVMVDNNVYTETFIYNGNNNRTELFRNDKFILAYNGTTKTIELGLIKAVTIKWVKLELGSVATQFVPRLYGEELALCQRYYFKNNWISTLMAHLGNGVMTTISYKYPVRMRTTPTVNKLVDKPVNIVRTKDFSVNIIDPDDSIISTKQSGIINNEMIDFQFNCSLDFKDYQIEIIDNAYEFDAEIY